MDPAMRLVDVRFAYGSAEVIRGVSLEVAPGEVVAVVGPNGAGKSTLLRLCAGLLVPSAGTVEIAGRPIAALSRREAAQRIALVPQATEVAFAFRVIEVVLMGRAPHLGPLGTESDADVALAEEALRQTDALSLRDRPFGELSGGERQRVIVARALAQTPGLLLLDEPTAFLDIRHQVELHDRLADLAAAGRFAVVAAMHDLNLAAAYANRVLLLREGASVACGTVEQVLTYARIRETFGADVYVGLNEITGARYFVPMSSRRGKAD